MAAPLTSVRALVTRFSTPQQPAAGTSVRSVRFDAQLGLPPTPPAAAAAAAPVPPPATSTATTTAAPTELGVPPVHLDSPAVSRRLSATNTMIHRRTSVTAMALQESRSQDTRPTAEEGRTHKRKSTNLELSADAQAELAKEADQEAEDGED